LEYLAVLLFALAVSADGFLVGVAYGFKRIRLPVLSLLVIAGSSALAVCVSMLLGRGLAAMMNPRLAAYIGAGMLIFMGMAFVFQAYWQHLFNSKDNLDEPLFSFYVKPLGIMVQILARPESADRDESGEISIQEAFMLGLALAMDALGAGIGMALAGFNILTTALGVGMVKFILVNLGTAIGRMFQGEEEGGCSSALAGCIFIILGFLQIYRK